MKSITEKAFAKLNLALSVICKRADGYHEMDMINQTVSLYDQITVELMPSGIQLISDMPNADAENDLTVKAAKAFFAAAHKKCGVKITVNKNIPVLAGLGGGSADAAAVLRALNTLEDNCLSQAQLNNVAVNVGADVPFCLYKGTARVQGIGEIITPLTDFLKCTVVLVRTGNKQSTAQMFEKLDKAEVQPYDITAAVEAVQKGDIDAFCALADNSFDKLYDNQAIKEFMIQKGARLALITGSGPVMYGLFTDELKAKDCYDSLKSKGMECWLCKTE